MARRGRRGTLSSKTYFPATGDQLQKTRFGVLWECAKSNTAQTPAGDKVRYAFLMGFSPEQDEIQFRSIHEFDGKEWLEGIDLIRRRISSTDSFREYKFDWETGTWKQTLEEE